MKNNVGYTHSNSRIPSIRSSFSSTPFPNFRGFPFEFSFSLATYSHPLPLYDCFAPSIGLCLALGLSRFYSLGLSLRVPFSSLAAARLMTIFNRASRAAILNPVLPRHISTGDRPGSPLSPESADTLHPLLRVGGRYREDSISSPPTAPHDPL